MSRRKLSSLRINRNAIVLASIVLSAFGRSSWALPVDGFTPWDISTGDGYRVWLSSYFPQDFTATVNNRGTTVGYSNRYANYSSIGQRATRFSASNQVATTELFSSGIDPTQFGTSTAYAVNSAGTAVGEAWTMDGANVLFGRPMRWDAGSSAPQRLLLPGALENTLPVDHARAFRINELGDVLGSVSRDSASDVRAVRWTAGSTSGVEFALSDHPVAPNDHATLQPIDMNADGDAIVQRTGLGQPSTIYFWQRGQSTSPLGNVFRVQGAAGANWASESYRAADINNAGWIAGTCDYVAVQGQPVRSVPVLWNSRNSQMVYDPGVPLALPTGFDPNTEYVVTARLNERGTVVGTYGRQGLSRGVIWTSPQAPPIVLQVAQVNGMPFEVLTDVCAINDFDYVVGTQINLIQGEPVQVAVPMLWRPNGSAIELNKLVTHDRSTPASTWSYYSVTSISNTGFVAGVGYYDPDGVNGVAAYPRQYTILVPEAGSYGRGDADLNGQINFDDLILLAQHYGQANAALAYDHADLNLDGTTNFLDLLTLAQHYPTAALTQVPAGLQADWLRAVSLVPEPVSALALPAMALRRRRRVRG